MDFMSHCSGEEFLKHEKYQRKKSSRDLMTDYKENKCFGMK